MRKRILSILLVLALCLAFLPVQVHAATITTLEIGGGVSYKVRVNDTIYIYRDTILVTGNGSINLDIPYKALSIDGGTAVDLDTIATTDLWEAGHTYEITLQIAPTDPADEFDTGITCTIDGKDVAVNVISVDTAELTYQVYPSTDATVDTPPVAKTGLVYNGDYQELTDPAEATGGTVLYSDSNTGPWSDEIRSEKNADTHDVWYMVKGDDSHFDTTPAGPVSVTIDQAPAPVLTATNPTIGLGSTINEGYLYEVSGLQGTDSITPTVTWATPLDTNTAEDYDYTVNAVYDGGVDGNYTGPIAAVTGTLTVSPLPTADYTQNPIPLAPTYNGQAQEIIAAATDQGEVQYSRDGGTTWSATVPTETNAGDYDLNVKIVGTVGQYLDSSVLVINAPIQPADGLTLAAKDMTITAGTAFAETDLYELTTGALMGTDEIELTIDWVAGAAPDINTPGDYEFNIAGYNIAAPGLDSNYAYLLLGETHGTLTVSALPVAVYSTAPAPTNPVYNGQPQELVTAASAQGEVQYSTDGGTTWSAAVPTGTNAGDYDIAVKIVGTAGIYSDSAPVTVNSEIALAPVTVTAKNTTVQVGAAMPAFTADVTGEVAGEEGTVVYTLTTTAADTATQGTYPITAAGAATQGNYAVTYVAGTLTIREAAGDGGGKDTPDGASYDFTSPRTGVGSYTSSVTVYTWGGRAKLPKDIATLYMFLANNSVADAEGKALFYPHLGTDHFLTRDDIWILPDSDPEPGRTYPVETVQVCEDHEPFYRANGDGKVDQSTFANSNFYDVAIGTGDKSIDFANLTTGDVVSNTTFNGVYVTKVAKSSNPSYEANLTQLKNDAIASFRAFELDHPEVFWLTGSVKLRVLTVTINGAQTSYIFMTLVDDKGFTMRIADYAAPGAIEAAIQQRDTAAAAIIAQVPASGTVREKIAFLNKWFTTNNEYNRSSDLNSIGYTPHRSLKSLLGNEGASGPVCDGYSRGLKVICDRLGIPMILDTGVASIGSHSELHMWTRVQVDGAWYGFDCTWDDPIVSGKNGKISGYENEKYLLVGNDTVVDGKAFGVSHPSNQTAGGTTGVLFASLMMNTDAIDGYTPLDFEDVRLADWFYEFVKKAVDKGLMGGTSEGVFTPQGTATRGQIVQILYNAAGQPAVDEVKVEGWFGKAATWAMDKGIVAGYADGQFHGEIPITREQLATILWAYEGAPEITGSTLDYADKDKIEGYAINAILWAKAEGILGGKPGNLIDPKGLATRAEIATIFSNFIK